MSSYSHFQFKIYLRRSLTLSLWCLMLMGFKPHLLHPLTPVPAPPGALPPYTPACQPASRPQWHPKPGSFPHSLKPFQTWWEAACSPRASVIWVVKPSDSPLGSWGAQPSAPTHKTSLKKGGPFFAGKHRTFTVEFIFISFFLRLKNSLVMHT